MLILFLKCEPVYLHGVVLKTYSSISCLQILQLLLGFSLLRILEIEGEWIAEGEFHEEVLNREENKEFLRHIQEG